MADNYVEIRIKASDTAKPDLTELRADLDELGRKVETARVDVDDEAAKLKLLELNAKLAALNRRAKMKLSVAGAARVESDIAKIRSEMGKLDQKAQQDSSKGGLLGKLLFGAAGVADKLPSNVQLPMLGGMSLPALVAIVPAIEAALVEVTGLASGFAAAGAGAGAFAALALPAFKKVTTAYTQISKDQKAYDDALTATAKNTALKRLQQDYKDLDPAQRGAVRGLQDLMSTYHRMAKAFEPQAFRVFNDGLKIANELLPHLTPFANTFANVLDGLLKRAGKFAGSKGFSDWLKQFRSLEGPALSAIGNGIGKVAVQVGKLLTSMSGKDVAHAITIAFDVLAGAIHVVTYSVRGLMRSWDQLSSAFRRVRHSLSSDTAAMREDFAHFGHSAESVFNSVKRALVSDADAMGATFARFGHRIESVFNAVKHALASDFAAMRADLVRFGHAVESATNRAVSLFRALPGRIRGALGNLGSLLFGAGQRVIQGLINGIESMVGAVGSAIGHIAGEITSHLPFSPAKKGPLSGAGDPTKSGRKITQMLAEGMTSGLGSVTSASARVAGGAAIGAHGGARGGAGGAGRIQLEFVGGDEPIVRALRQMIRVKGGDVQVVLGH